MFYSLTGTKTAECLPVEIGQIIGLFHQPY